MHVHWAELDIVVFVLCLCFVWQIQQWSLHCSGCLWQRVGVRESQDGNINISKCSNMHNRGAGVGGPHAFNNEQGRQQYLSALPCSLPACYEILACRPCTSEGRTWRKERDLVWKYLDQNVSLAFNWVIKPYKGEKTMYNIFSLLIQDIMEEGMLLLLLLIELGPSNERYNLS